MPPQTPEGDSRPVRRHERGEATDPFPTPEELDAWLAGHAPDQTVGARLDIRACPLACYLSERTGRTWAVNGSWAEEDGTAADVEMLMLPPWLASFTAWVDAHPEQSVDAQAARVYLDAALRQHGAHGNLNE